VQARGGHRALGRRCMGRGARTWEGGHRQGGANWEGGHRGEGERGRVREVEEVVVGHRGGGHPHRGGGGCWAPGRRSSAPGRRRPPVVGHNERERCGKRREHGVERG
jgi:hypothetical protein